MSAMWPPAIMDAIILSVLLLIGHFLKRKIPLFKRFLLPSAMIAGFLGLAAGPELLGIAPLDIERLGVYVYHLLSVGFIALTLKDRPMTASRPVVKTAFFIVSVYLIQGIIGLGLSLILAATIFPDLFPAIGLILPLGFGQGPGQAYSIGRTWENAGVLFGGGIGLTMATIGFLWATFGGVFLANRLRHRFPPAEVTRGQESAAAEITDNEAGELPLSNMIDGGTLQLFLIGLIYLAVYGTLQGLSALLAPLGSLGQNLANVLWGFHFVFGTIYAVVVKIIMNRLKRIGLMTHTYNNNYLLSRISGTAFDFMVTAAIAAISIEVLQANWAPILIITTLGGLATAWFALWAARRVFKTDVLEYTLGFFGTYTGTLSTGMALLRTVDPGFRTRVADSLVLGGGLALFLAFPLLIILNIPLVGFTEGRPELYLLTLGLLVAYLALTIFGLVFTRKSRRAGASGE
ncbi:sodium:glutamate symporter [Spirochaeta lutea]|uniref:Sodium:glutamate symporter n=2 Tax=Spirochaeta lutea TaxID=1480694 RepID=A0A098QZC9_9SPIO|nr:sodium:glutamate symporter [Spirochaeta lutea]